MKKIGFIGAYDKIDFMIYISKILQRLNYKVLVVDATTMQKSKYIVPTINPTKSYITSFEDVDFAVGFKSWEDIEKYLGIRFDYNDNEIMEETKKIDNELYDFILLDIDTKEAFCDFKIQKNEKNYFVTAFDIYSLRKGIDILRDLSTPVKMTKILFSYHQTKEEEEYLNTISLEFNVNWSDYTFYTNINYDDNRTIQENQRTEKILFKRLSNSYKESIAYVVQDINKQENLAKIKKAMKE